MLKLLSVSEAINTDQRDRLEEVLPIAATIVADIRRQGDAALMRYAKQFGDVRDDYQVIYTRKDLENAAQSIPSRERKVLERMAQRVTAFADAQRKCLADLNMTVEGGRAGHQVLPLESAACYAPGGRYPLPSSVIMTACTARVAGVKRVWVISPKPTKITLAAAYIAGADQLLAIGGAQAIAAAAFGTETVERFDVIVGPGNNWVTAAKQLVSGYTRIDMLAGPSELLVIADASANPALVAADLLAQAEHDPDSRVILLATAPEVVTNVNEELTLQLEDLQTAEVARASLKHGYAVITPTYEEAAMLSNRIAPEHLSLQIAEIDSIWPLLSIYGSLFIGASSCEVLGDYGVGPNHVLPTQASARSRGGLSVYDFLKVVTWIEMEDSVPSRSDIVTLARMEGLEAHARAIEARMTNAEQR